eukprot:RCo020259
MASESGALSAPCKYVMPVKLDSAVVADLWVQLDQNVRDEILSVSEKNVVYELVQSFLNKYGDRDVCESTKKVQMSRCFEFFRFRLQPVDLEQAVNEVRMVFVTCIEQKTTALRFEATLRHVCETFYNSQCAVGALLDNESLSAIQNSPLKGIEAPMHCGCYAEEIDEEVLSFADYKDTASKADVQARAKQQEQDKGKKKDPKKKLRRLIIIENADAKTAYSLSMFMWTVAHMLLKRLAIVGRHKEQQHDQPATVEVVRELTKETDNFQAALQRANRLKEEGNNFYREQQWKEALEKYTMAVDASPPGDDNKYLYYSNRAACYNQLELYAEAVDDCGSALLHNPKFFKALYRRAQAYECLDKKELAIQDLECLLRDNPGNLQARQFYEKLTGTKVDYEPFLRPPPAPPAPAQSTQSSDTPANKTRENEEGEEERKRKKKKKKKDETEAEAAVSKESEEDASEKLAKAAAAAAAAAAAREEEAKKRR